MGDDRSIIINGPYEEPRQHWPLGQGGSLKITQGRRKSQYIPSDESHGCEEISLVNQIRPLVKKWREEAMRGGGGVSRTTMDLLKYWRGKERSLPLFFAQLEAAETVIFLAEARADYLQGIDIPRDELSELARREGYKDFTRWCCKLATGGGKTTVMGMLAAWSILNKIAARGDSRYSDAVLVVCPNVTIRERLGELDPQRGNSSIYRSRDLVPPSMMPALSQGKVLAINWHLFETQSMGTERVVKIGKRTTVHETIHIGGKNQNARGKKYMTLENFIEKEKVGMFKVISKKSDKNGVLTSVVISGEKYMETDNAMIRRVLGREFGGKRNMLVMNDEAHHAYRIRHEDGNERGEQVGDEEFADEYYREATVWVEGLDKIHKLRGILRCLDFSATPYFLGRAGENSGKIFPWTVSDFGLSDAIESGLVKAPQFPVRMKNGGNSYHYLWDWILQKLTPRERGGKKSDVKPHAVLKYAHTALTLMVEDWERTRKEWEKKKDEARPPVLIIVCKNVKLAKVIYEWITGHGNVGGVKPSDIKSLHNHSCTFNGSYRPQNTIRVDSKVSNEIESGNVKGDEKKWMRFVLGTIGKRNWPEDDQNRPIYPPEFEALADKLCRPKTPPGRDVRCIVSVSMLTEGWDCSTVTHIVGLRPFMSQLLCEQVVGRGLRRASYEINEKTCMFGEEFSTVFGVPFEVPIKGEGTQNLPVKIRRNHVYTVKERHKHAMSFPLVEGYRSDIHMSLRVNWPDIPLMTISDADIPNKADVKPGIMGVKYLRASSGPGKTIELNLEEFRRRTRLQEGQFDLASDLVSHITSNDEYCIPAPYIFRQILLIVRRYFAEKVKVNPPCQIVDAFLSPRYQKIQADLINAFRPGKSGSPIVPVYEDGEVGGTDNVECFTSREIFPVSKSHINAVVMDSKMEGRAAYLLDQHPKVKSFVKNDLLERVLAIPYMADDGEHEYRPDFIVRLLNGLNLILETKGYDDTNMEQKSAGASRWVDAVNADNRHGQWRYKLVRNAEQIPQIIDKLNAE